MSMTEGDVTNYLRNEATFVALCPNIYKIQAPKDAKMPYAIIEFPGGPREKSGDKTDEHVMIRVTVDCGPGQETRARQAIDTALDLMDNYRGAMGNATDVYVQCGSVRSWAGLAGTTRYQFDGKARHIISRVTNP